MLGIKTYLLKKISSKFEDILRENSFPKNNLSFIQEKIISWSIVKKLKEESNRRKYQTPVSQFTHPLFRKITKKILQFNPNNLGNWLEVKPFNLSGLLERKIVNYVIDLISGKKNKLGGYLASGGTESNLFMMWMGRNLLKKKLKVDKMLVLYTGLTHYSIYKSANITNIDTLEVSISSKNWGMDPKELKRTIIKEYKKGKSGFLIPLTLGYTITGSDDPIADINDLVTDLKKELPNSMFFCWIDAAFSGIIKPFSSERFEPFSYSNIDGFLTDFHKFPAFPYPSGIVLYKKKLIKHIEQKVSYIGMNDSTLLGSRTGITAISTWYCLRILNKNGFEKMIKKSLKEKNEFISQINKSCPKSIIITQKNSVQAGILSTNILEDSLLKKMGLHPTEQKIILDNKNKKIKLYKLYFLPHFEK